MAMGYLIPTSSWLKRKLTELSLAGKCKQCKLGEENTTKNYKTNWELHQLSAL